MERHSAGRALPKDNASLLNSLKDVELRRLIAGAETFRAEYAWSEAAKAYGEAAARAKSLTDSNQSLALLEREQGFCYLRSAFQSQASADFVKLIKLAESSYSSGNSAAEDIPGELGKAISIGIKADLCIPSFHLAGNREDRRTALQRNTRSRREALGHFQNTDAQKETEMASIKCLEAACLELNMEWSPDERRKIVSESLELGANSLGNAVDERNLAWIYLLMGELMGKLVYLLDDNLARERTKRGSVDYTTKAIALAGRIDDKFLISRSNLSAISAIGYTNRTEDLFKSHLRTALDAALATRDSRLIADSLATTAYDLIWDMISEEFPERRIAKLEECRRIAEEALSRYNAIDCVEGTAACYGIPLTQAYYRASVGVVEKAEKGALLEEAAKYGGIALEAFVRSGFIGSVGVLDNTPAQGLATVLCQQSVLSTDDASKRAKLTKAAALASEVHLYRASYAPHNNWDRGVDLDTEATIQFELSKTELDKRQKMSLLKAVATKEWEALRLCKLHFEDSKKIPRNIAMSMSYIAIRLYRSHRELFILTGDRDSRDMMMLAQREMAALYEGCNAPSRAAEAHWRMGQVLGREASYIEASHEFEASSRLFELSARGVPQFSDYFRDYSKYMTVWSLITGARAKTALQDYGGSSADYAKASELLGTTVRWKDASSYFAAWGKLQTAEALSARESFSEAIKIFEEAQDFFSRSEKFTADKTSEVMVQVEDQLDIPRLSAFRKQYCEARTRLESARMLDFEEERADSASEYGLASIIFGKIAAEVEPGVDRDEFTSMSLLCHGWKALKEAEVNHSTTLFSEASRAFEEAARLKVTDRLVSIATANARFCEATGLGVEFARTGDVEVYAKAKNRMEAARSEYAELEARGNAIWTEAAMSILDSRLFLFKGESAPGPGERARFYAMAEKSLDVARTLAKNAGYNTRATSIDKELARVMRKTKVAQDLAELVSTPPITSPGNLILAQGTEEAKGLSAFEGLNVQGQVRHERQVEVGDAFDVQVDVFNAGNTPASLLKIEDIATAGLEIVSAQDPYSFEGPALDTRERIIQPLRIQSFRVSLRPSETGEKTLAPTLVLKDDAGRVNLQRLAGTTISVLPQSIFEFKSPTAKVIFDSLVKAFVTDYMHNKQSLEQSGWRSRGEVQDSCKVSRAALYEGPGKYGSPLYELLSRGLVEVRTFKGHRGRGGEAIKLRILYGKDTVRRYVDRTVMRA